MDEAHLLCRAGSCVCALPLVHVSETMRALPLEALGGMPDFVLGLAIVRGAPTPVVDVSRLVGGARGAPARFVTVKTRRTPLALAFDEVLGVRVLAPRSLQEIPPLLGGSRAGIVSAIGALDRELLVLLEAARALPESVWAALAARGARP